MTGATAGRGARADGELFRAALASSSPVEVLNQPLFNPTGGYGTYIVPAAFILILQQTLLMGIVMVGGIAYVRSGRSARRARGRPASVLGQALAHLALALPGFALYLIVLPSLYGFSRQGGVLDLLCLAIPFILAVSFLAQAIGACFTRRESAVMLFISLGLPLFFLAGVAWPIEAIPPALHRAAMAIPSTVGIDAFVRVNQMGASLADVRSDWGRLWLLALVYGVLAVVVPAWSSRLRRNAR